jgi:hypothetical protein
MKSFLIELLTGVMCVVSTVLLIALMYILI